MLVQGAQLREWAMFAALARSCSIARVEVAQRPCAMRTANIPQTTVIPLSNTGEY